MKKNVLCFFALLTSAVSMNASPTSAASAAAYITARTGAIRLASEELRQSNPELSAKLERFARNDEAWFRKTRARNGKS